MKLPYIVLVDDDEQVLRALQRDIRTNYRADYHIAAASSPAEAIELINSLKLNNEELALIISDQRMPEMEGVDFLEKIKPIFPDAKMVLLTAYSDIQAAIKAINAIRLDYFLMKPWNPPQEKLYPVVSDMLDNWQSFYKPTPDCIKIIGFQWSPKSHAIKEFLSGNLIPFLWMDVDGHSQSAAYMESAGLGKADLPMVILKDGHVLADPDLPTLATYAGLQQNATECLYDVLIVGAGPAGLAASVYGSCEGLKTVLIEKSNPGGQAGNSARIENYLGFPTGLSGAELTHRAMAQTLRFGTEVLTPKTIAGIRLQDGYKLVEMTDGSIIHTKAIVISTGVQYTQLNVPGIDQFTGSGVYYGSASVEANACRNAVVFIVGGGNSACQAALHMAKFAREVNILIRRDELKLLAANYLVENIAKTPNIKVLPHTEVLEVHGENELQRITLVYTPSGETRTLDAKALFIYIGQKPGTQWLQEMLITSETGQIKTGSELVKDSAFHRVWKLDREPYLPETSVPGIFASGDVRYAAMTGISAAVGEGAMAIRFVRKYLSEM